MNGVTFYLGTHETSWLRYPLGPLFVSHRRLRKRRTLPRAATRWVLDSGGFSELNEPPYRWTTRPEQYVSAVCRYRDEIGGMDWAAPMDWMCEPHVVAKTGLTVGEHQRRTIANLLELRALAPDVPWVPVLQGWRLADYERHVDDYCAAGVDLAAEPLVAVGTVCRRQATTEIAAIMWTLYGYGLRLHGFGVKTRGLAMFAAALASADSMAWSYDARRSPSLLDTPAWHERDPADEAPAASPWDPPDHLDTPRRSGCGDAVNAAVAEWIGRRLGC